MYQWLHQTRNRNLLSKRMGIPWDLVKLQTIRLYYRLTRKETLGNGPATCVSTTLPVWGLWLHSFRSEGFSWKLHVNCGVYETIHTHHQSVKPMSAKLEATSFRLAHFKLRVWTPEVSASLSGHLRGLHYLWNNTKMILLSPLSIVAVLNL